jgi:hypothetical protein
MPRGKRRRFVQEKQLRPGPWSHDRALPTAKLELARDPALSLTVPHDRSVAVVQNATIPEQGAARWRGYELAKWRDSILPWHLLTLPPRLACRFHAGPFDVLDETARSRFKIRPREGDSQMRFMVLVKATSESEAGALPSTEMLNAMGKYNEELAAAGVMLAGEGLHPSSKGARVKFSGSRRTVTDGPFAETKELIAGFWILQVKSREEVIEWVKRCPNPMEGESEIEIRQIFEADDFGDAFTPEARAAEQQLRQQIASRH